MILSMILIYGYMFCVSWIVFYFFVGTEILPTNTQESQGHLPTNRACCLMSGSEYLCCSDTAMPLFISETSSVLETCNVSPLMLGDHVILRMECGLARCTVCAVTSIKLSSVPILDNILGSFKEFVLCSYGL